MNPSKTKKFMYVCRRAPYGTIYAFEAMELMLMGSAFGQDISVAFIDDGIYQLAKYQDPASIGMKQFTKGFKALPDFDIGKLYVEEESLNSRGLVKSDLIEIPMDDLENAIEFVPAEKLSELMAQQDVLLQF